MRNMRIAIFASGNGSNAESIMRASREGRLEADVELILSNNPKAGVLEKAQAYEVKHTVIESGDFGSEAEYVKTVCEILDAEKINFIALAGYLKMIHPDLIDKYNNKITNIHPALLPSFGGKGFYGKRVHEAVLVSGCKVSGVTVHIVDKEYDRGPIVAQTSVPVLDDDTPETLAERVLIEEHKIYPETLQLFAENRVVVKGRITTITGKA
ncbi:MAG: phosphoribosylglycinamide formyltransferase [Candidatus Marinimicrobia bacterium]|nr:phosphoribosylglycinamide formyltransferase [Candidatus Neomarinimicrobiota bacterium]